MTLPRLRRGHIPPGAMFRITQTGEEELQRFEVNDDQAILTALQTNGTLNIHEIAERSGLSMGTVERRLPPLVNRASVQMAGGEVTIPQEGSSW